KTVRKTGSGSPQPSMHSAVLYVHGFTDYFFQRDLADFFTRHGYAFYALDLRKCGRSRRDGQTAHYISDLAMSDHELSECMCIVSAATVGAPCFLAAHSTDGLILPLWLDAHRRH